MAIAGKWTRIDDIFPIQNVFFPACYVSLSDGIRSKPPSKEITVECSHSRDVGVPQTDSKSPLKKIAGTGR